MTDKVKTTPENINTLERVKDSVSPKNIESIPKQHFGAGHEALNTLGSIESGEIAQEISEITSKGSEKKGGSFKTAQKSTPAQIRAALLNNAPSEKVMIGEIKREITKEIGYLQSKVRKIMRTTGSVNSFELNNIVKKIRELRRILSELAGASIDALKNLWIRFVKGII